MKLRLVLAVALVYALMPTGDSLMCYNSCKNDTASCNQTEVCPPHHACVTLTTPGGDTIHSCVEYSKCYYYSRSSVQSTENSHSVSQYTTFSCCGSDLCNSAPAASTSLLIGLLCSLLAVWWTTP